MLPLDAGRAAVRIAREAAEAEVLRKRPARSPVPARLKEPRGAFVTLLRGAELRGCVGYVEPRDPLHDVLALAARGAARDPRFDAVRARELEELTVEVSVLTPPQPLGPLAPDALAERVRIGTHGLVVARGRHRGLLLPQVAVEHGFTAEQFLDATCSKAGLAPDAWRRAGMGLEWHAFESQVFRELAPRGDVAEAAPDVRPEVA